MITLGEAYQGAQINSREPGPFYGVELEYEKIGTSWHRWAEAVYEKDKELGMKVARIWQVKQDGSLRGDSAGEFCFSGPYPDKVAREALDLLFKAFEVWKMPTVSIRTGLHVHLNVRDMTIVQLRGLMALYALFEPAWYTYAKADRSGNVFCQPWWRDFGYLHDLSNITTREHFHWQGFGKYSGLNLNPVATFGSVEFRHMPSTTDVKRIHEWLDLIKVLRDSAMADRAQHCLDKAINRSPSEAFAELLGPALFRSFYYRELDEEVYNLSLDVASHINNIPIIEKEWLPTKDAPVKKKTTKAAPRRVVDNLAQVMADQEAEVQRVMQQMRDEALRQQENPRENRVRVEAPPNIAHVEARVRDRLWVDETGVVEPRVWANVFRLDGIDTPAREEQE